MTVDRGQAARRIAWPVTGAIMLWALVGLGACGRHETIDLSRRVDAAQRRWETHRIDFGTREARPHLTAGWGLDEQWGDTSMVWALGERSEVDFFLAVPRPLTLRMRCGPLSFPDLPPQTVHLALNGRPLGSHALGAEPAEYAMALPAEALRAGINRLEFDYAHAHRPMDLDPKSTDQRRLSVAWDWLAFDGVTDVVAPAPARKDGDPVMTLPVRSEISFYFDLPSGATLLFDGLERGGGGAPAAFEVRAEGVGGTAPLVQQWIVGGSGTGSQRVPLGRSGLTKLTMRAVPIGTGSEVDGRIRISAPRLTMPIFRAANADESCGAFPTTPTAPPPVVMYMIDTLRADHMGCYGYGRPTTPQIDAFARDAVRFSHAIAQSSWTEPSVASVFTGLTPREHGINRQGNVLPDLPTLAGLLRADGYETAALVTNTNVAPWTGLDRGFDSYRLLNEEWVASLSGSPMCSTHSGPDMLEWQVEDQLEHQGADVLRRQALAWLDARTSNRPFFLYLHASDPHAPYSPRDPFRQQLAANADLRLGMQSAIEAITEGRRDVSDRERDMIESLYDADIAFVDAEFGALLDDLRARGLYDRALIILVADHGEGFGEHGQWQHSTTLFEELIRVPLLVKFPGQWHGNRVSDGVAQHADILPTVLGYLGIDSPAEISGRSLLPKLACPGAPREVAAAYSYIADPETESLVIGDRKLIHHFVPDSSRRRFELYDLGTDPDEMNDVALQRPIEVGYLSTLMAPFARSHPRAAARPTHVIDAADQERLRALGYAP